MKTYLKFISFVITLVMLTGCATNQKAQIIAGSSAVQLRSIQTRAFDTNDKTLIVRNVIATLQDLSFVIDKADGDLGTVTATKLSGYQIRMTVTARPKSKTQMLVRANAQYNLEAIEDPELYQDFFSALQKALFLTAHSVE